MITTKVPSPMTFSAESDARRIEKIEVCTRTIPTDSPESDGTIEWDKTTIVIVTANCAGAAGLGYTYTDGSAAKLIESLLREAVEGRDAMDIPGAWAAMTRAVRNVGRDGIAATAISAIDIALWDLKAKLLELPLVKLLGAVRSSVPAYGSGGFTSYSTDQLQRQFSNWVGSGFRMVKMKVGRNPKDDVKRVCAAREAIGDRAELFVDANGAYSRKHALSFAQYFRKANVTWFEEPVSSDDLGGLRLIRNRAPAGMEIAAGEYGYTPQYFRRMLESGAVDVLQADATRCGGVTGFLQAAALCESYGLPLSAHTAPSVHSQICCATANARHVEYFHDHARIESMLFNGAAVPKNGELVPDLSRHGIGLELHHASPAKRASA